MTRRSALIAGLTALMVLLSGQAVGAWYRRPSAGPTTASYIAAIASRPTPTGSPGTGSKPTPGPTKPAGSQNGKSGDGKLEKMGVRSVTGDRGIMLTFDDGPHPTYTPKILSILRANHVRAVFCVVGTEVRKYPHLVAQIAREGHTLCNHSWHHEFDLGKWPAQKMHANLARTNAEIERAAPGTKVPFFRQPGGLWTPAVVKMARELGMTAIGWTVDPSDWERPSANAIRARVLKHAHPGAIVLMHDGGGDRSHTVAACQRLIPALRQRHTVVQLR